jgi:electron transfer flavoprotein alpha subunit
MAEILVLVEHLDGNVKKVTSELLTLARRLGEPSAVFVGTGFDKAQDKLAEFGAHKVYVAEGADYDAYVVAPKAEVLAKVVGDTSPAAVLVASTPDGKEIAGRLAVKTGSGLLTDAVNVSSDLLSEQSVFGGSTIVKSKVTEGTPIITVRPNSTAPEASAGPAERVDVSVDLPETAKVAKVVEKVVAAKDGRPELTEASIVVSGGRGVGSAENFSIIEKLADALGGAVGASRAATDSGYYPHQYQVGQTGKTVSPQLYLAVGISGAIQHRAGMQTSKTIVAINKDPEAPIFELADFGIVGDLNTVVPQLTAEVESRKG